MLIDRGEVKKKIRRCRPYANGERSTAKRKCVNYRSRTRRSSSFAAICAGRRQRRTADWASIRRSRPHIIRPAHLIWKLPLLDNNGKFSGQYELRLDGRADVGGAIAPALLIFTRIGPDAGHRAGWYNHYGRVWVLKARWARR